MASFCDLTPRRLGTVRGCYLRHFILTILNVRFQITRLLMHDGVAAVVISVALIKGFTVRHGRHYSVAVSELSKKATSNMRLVPCLAHSPVPID